MPTLFSYCIKSDSGFAPNPYHGICTLVTCKPTLRRHAKIGDWIAAVGSKNSPIGDISLKVVAIMRVTVKMTMREYDVYCSSELPQKRPNMKSSNFIDRVGDCIYDYSGGSKPELRRSLHAEEDMATDLSGEYALLSDHFWYFGDQPIDLPEHLIPIEHRRGYKSNSNAPYLKDFEAWVAGFKEKPGSILGSPQRMELLAACSDCTSYPNVRTKIKQAPGGCGTPAINMKRNRNKSC